ncbi:MAG: hypothetical protein ABEI57_00535 [Halapricum sp.]
MSIRPIAVAALVLLASLAPMAAAGSTVHTQRNQTAVEAYSGSHVTFGTNDSALVDYAVGGDTVASSVKVQSESQVESNLGLGMNADLESMTSFSGAGLSMQSSAQASASITADSGATIEAHDYSHGTLVVNADQSQYVALGLNSSSDAQAESDQRVLVTTDDGTKAAVMVVGDGNVTVNEDGNVTADVKADSKLVVRSYSEERTESDQQTEQMIVNGTAAAEVYADQQNGQQVAGTISYNSDTDVNVEQQTESTVNMTVDRAQHEGTVVIASASQFAAESTDDVAVRVDGEAAAKASSYSELRAAADGGSTSKYMVKNSASAKANAEVLVAVNHFSKRSVSMTSADTSSNADVQGSAYSGSHVGFQSNGSALVGYTVGGDTVASTVKVQSESQVESNLGLGMNADLESVTSFTGASLSMQSSAQASASITADSDATIEAHDYSHGTLVVNADQSQYVALGLNSSSDAKAESDQRVLVTTDDGTKAAVMVVGDGNVTVNEDGNVTADVKADSKLVVRSYSEERTESDQQTEQLIVDGKAAAEVYVDQQNGQRVTGTISYNSDTDVSVDAKSEETVDMTVDRAQHEGTVVIASTAFDAQSNDDVNVTVDGEAAAEASSYSKLQAAADGGSTSKYMVKNSASAKANAEVLVAVNHFSKRSVTMSQTSSSGTDSGTNGDNGTNGSGSNSDSGSGSGPGFGIGAALLSLFALSALVVRRDR